MCVKVCEGVCVRMCVRGKGNEVCEIMHSVWARVLVKVCV